MRKGLGSIVSIIMAKHMKDDSISYVNFSKSTGTTHVEFVDYVRNAIHHAQMLLYNLKSMGTDIDYNFTEINTDNESSLGELLSISLDIDKAVKNSIGFSKFFKYIDQEIGVDCYGE